MNVTFTRTGERRYRVSVEGPGVISSRMEPAPGYDDRLPHDMAHFVVENELGIMGGVFGQLASGGTAGTFHPVEAGLNRKIAKRSKKISAASRDDAQLSEKVVYLAVSTWSGNASFASPVEGVSEEGIKRICSEFDAVSAVWSQLPVGGSMTLPWTADRAASNKNRSKRK
jgi:hypothetical protein